MMRPLLQARAFGEIQEDLVNGALALFASFGMPISHAPTGGVAKIEGSSVMAIIGFADASMRGSILVLTSHTVVEALLPATQVVDAPADVIARDTLGEFSNMMAGRVKNRLSIRGVAPLLTIPTTVFGDELDVEAPRIGMSAWHTFTSGAGPIFVRLDTTFESSFTLGPAPDGDGDGPHEGDVVLF